MIKKYSRYHIKFFVSVARRLKLLGINTVDITVGGDKSQSPEGSNYLEFSMNLKNIFFMKVSVARRLKLLGIKPMELKVGSYMSLSRPKAQTTWNIKCTIIQIKP